MQTFRFEELREDVQNKVIEKYARDDWGFGVDEDGRDYIWIGGILGERFTIDGERIKK